MMTLELGHWLFIHSINTDCAPAVCQALFKVLAMHLRASQTKFPALVEFMF